MPEYNKSRNAHPLSDPLSCFFFLLTDQSPADTLSRSLSLIRIRHKLQRTVLRCPPVVTVVSIHFILLRQSH